MNTPMPSPDAAPDAGMQPVETPSQDMAIIQIPHAALMAAAKGAESLLPVIQMIVEAAAKAQSDIDAQKGQGGPGTLAPDQGAQGDEGLANEIDQMRSSRR